MFNINATNVKHESCLLIGLLHICGRINSINSINGFAIDNVHGAMTFHIEYFNESFLLRNG